MEKTSGYTFMRFMPFGIRIDYLNGEDKWIYIHEIHAVWDQN